MDESLGDYKEPTMDEETGLNERRILYRESSSSKKMGPFTLADVSKWYENRMILPSAEFSVDDGANWTSIVELRRQNGPANPFLPTFASGVLFGNMLNGIEAIDAEKARIALLEQDIESELNNLKEEERLLIKMSVMEKINDPETSNEVDGKNNEKSVPVPSSSSVAHTRIKFKTLEIKKVNLADIPNPFDEIAHPGNPDFVLELINRMSVENILVINSKNCAIPIGIDPIDILRLFPAPFGDVELTVAPYVNKLRQVFGARDRHRFKGLVNFQFTDFGKPYCAMCETSVSRVPSLLLAHVAGVEHVDKMKERRLTFSMEALAYWMMTLRIAQKNGPWFIQRVVPESC